MSTAADPAPRPLGVGFYRGFSTRLAPRQEWPRETLNRVIGYLESGHRAGGYLMRWDKCVLGCTAHTCPGVAMYLTETYLTDGRWMWPLQLIHLVAFHRFDLPPEFLRHMQANDWQPPGEPWCFPPGVRIDHSLWLAWYRRHRRPWYRWFW